jgi:hypothetical protein
MLTFIGNLKYSLDRADNLNRVDICFKPEVCLSERKHFVVQQY